ALQALGGKGQQAQQSQAAPKPAPAAKPGKKDETPAIWAVYFTRNYGKAGDKVPVVVVAAHSEKKSYAIALFRDDKQLKDAGQVTIKRGKGRLEVEIPADLPQGALVEARVTGEGLSAKTSVLFEIETDHAATE